MAESPEKRIKMSWPGYTGEANPDSFNVKAMLPQPKELKPGQLPEKLIKQYFEEGYLIIEDFFKPEELEACKDTLEILVEELAQKLYKAGKVKSLYKDYGLFQRLTKLEEEFPGAVILLHKIGKIPQSFRDLWANERLLNLIEQLIGPDISGSPNWNLRTKTPHTTSMEVPWHQDSAYLDNESYSVLIPTVWIPFLDTDAKNGGMEVVERGHLPGKIAMHQCCAGDSWYIMVDEDVLEEELGVDMKKDSKLCPIPYGGMLLFNNIIPHRSLPNISNDIRWSVDLRFVKTGEASGYSGIKDPIVFRSSKNPNLKIDWETFDSVDRSSQLAASVKGVIHTPEASEFDTTIQGPWMKKWELTHINKHVRKHQSTERS